MTKFAKIIELKETLVLVFTQHTGDVSLVCITFEVAPGERVNVTIPCNGEDHYELAMKHVDNACEATMRKVVDDILSQMSLKA